MSDNLKKDILSVASANNRTVNNQSEIKSNNYATQILKPPQNSKFTLKNSQVLCENGGIETNK